MRRRALVDDEVEWKIETAIQTFFLIHHDNKYTPRDVLDLCMYILLVMKGKR